MLQGYVQAKRRVEGGDNYPWASQKKALSVYAGDVILDYAELRRLVIGRLRENDCGDAADILRLALSRTSRKWWKNSDTAVDIIKKGFKTLREERSREEERKWGPGKQAILEGEL